MQILLPMIEKKAAQATKAAKSQGTDSVLREGTIDLRNASDSDLVKGFGKLGLPIDVM